MKTIIPLPCRPRETLNVAFAGHRRVRDRARARLAIRSALIEISKGVDLGGRQICLYSSPAAGADLIALEVAEALQWRIHLVLPMETGGFEKTFDGFASEWPLAASMIQRFRKISPAGYRAGENSYQAAARCMLDHADCLMAFWDGKPEKGPGGTAETIREAVERGLPTFFVEA